MCEKSRRLLSRRRAGRVISFLEAHPLRPSAVDETAEARQHASRLPQIADKQPTKVAAVQACYERGGGAAANERLASDVGLDLSLRDEGGRKGGEVGRAGVQ